LGDVGTRKTTPWRGEACVRGYTPETRESVSLRGKHVGPPKGKGGEGRWGRNLAGGSGLEGATCTFHFKGMKGSRGGTVPWSGGARLKKELQNNGRGGSLSRTGIRIRLSAGGKCHPVPPPRVSSQAKENKGDKKFHRKRRPRGVLVKSLGVSFMPTAEEKKVKISVRHGCHALETRNQICRVWNKHKAQGKNYGAIRRNVPSLRTITGKSLGCLYGFSRSKGRPAYKEGQVFLLEQQLHDGGMRRTTSSRGC